jgi:glycosyltransferase involved in cell wall biosynthesis
VAIGSRRPLKIILACNFAKDETLGSSRVPLRLAKELSRLGADVSTIFSDTLSSVADQHLEQASAPFRMAAALNMRAATADIVDIAGGDSWSYAILKRACRPWQRVVARSNGLWFRALEVEPSVGRSRIRRAASFVYQAQVTRRWERLSIQRADLSIFSANHDAEDVLNLGWAPPERVTVIPLGVDDVFESAVSLSERKDVAFIGALHYRKGGDVLAAVMSSLLLARPELRLALFGAGMEESEAWEHFDARVRNRIEVVPTVPPAELAKQLGRFAVLVLPTRYEGFGLVVLEAMRAGLAVVVTPTGAGADLVRDDENGVIVPIGDVAATRQAIEGLLDDRERRIRIAEAGRTEARIRSWEKSARDLLAAYESTFSHPPRRV